jgi:hypothetical protein
MQNEKFTVIYTAIISNYTQLIFLIAVATIPFVV